jgi:sugar/nucleoside kinase (ribokinase family)
MKMTAENLPRRWRLLSYGDPCVDVVTAVARLPERGGKVLGRPIGVLSGGTTSNFICAAGRLGLASAIFGRVGDDAHGAMLRDSIAGFGVATDHLWREAGTPSACAFIMVTPDGEKSIVYQPMAPMSPGRDALAAAAGQSQVVYAMPYDLEEFDLLSKVAHEQGALVAIDLEAAVAPDFSAMSARAERADIVFFNQAGFVAGTGREPDFESMRSVLALGPRLVVVTLGAAGAMAVSAAEQAAQAAFPARVVDATGAGDSFNAAFLALWLDGATLAEALRFACAAASCTVAAAGAKSALPDRSQVEALLESAQGSTK